MYNAMMDPELMRLAQEQMSRISPQELAKIQQQMMSNPELMKMASESMKDMRPEDLKRAAEQLKNVKTEDMAEISEKVAKAKPEELAAMKAHADAQISYETRAAQMLKQEGNKLHSAGKFSEAADKYLRAKNNLQGVPSAKGGTLQLQLQCSLNLMSCYLKTAQYRDCIKEGSEVLTYDSVNVKALYRRGQAYKELGNLEAALSDLRKAHEISPDDETIAAVFRDTEEKSMKSGFQTRAGGVVIEEIEEEGTSAPSQVDEMTSSYSVSQPNEGRKSASNNGSVPGISTADVERLKNLKNNPETLRSFQNYVSSANPDMLAAMGVGGMPPDMVKTATDMISKMKPEELQKMMEAASSLPNGSRDAPHIPEMTPEMIKMASDKMKNMSPEELQNMLDAASKMNLNSNSSSTPQIPEMTPDMIKMASDKMKNTSPEELQNMLDVASKMNLNSNSASNSAQIPEMTPDMIKIASDAMKSMSPEELQNMFKMASSMNPSAQSSTPDSGSGPSTTSGSSTISQTNEEGTSSSGLFSNSESTSCSSNVPIPSDLQESVRNSMKDPAMRQMFTSMMKNISPEMMASMSEQYGMKMSKEDAAKAQQVMSSLSSEDLDKMMRWADRAQRCIETAKKAKNWLLGRRGLILAICILILALILHRFGFIAA